MKQKLLVLVIVAVFFSLTGCKSSETKVSTGGTYIVQQAGEPATLNPDTISDDYNYEISQNIFNRLVKLNNAYQVLPDLASEWEISEDALTYTFKLKENVLWHDGQPFSSADVVYTYQTIMEQQYAHASVFAYVTDILAPDDNTVVFTLSQPDGSFISNLAWYGTFILPKHVLEGQDWLTSSFAENPVGTGPFKFTAWNKGTDVRIERNENFFGDKALLDSVIYTIIPDNNTAYQAWLNGEVDEVDFAVVPSTEKESLASNPDYKMVKQEYPSPYYLTFNLVEGPFANALVRQAMLYGIDRQEISDKTSNGINVACEYTIPLIFADYLDDNAKYPSYDPAKAMELLEQAGYTKGEDGYYFETTLKIFSGFDDQAAVVIDNLDKIGIKAKLTVLDYNVWSEQVDSNYDFEVSMLSGFQGPDVLGTGRRWTTTGSTNISRYSNSEVDSLYQQALAASSNEQIKEIYNQIQEILFADVPNVNLIEYTMYAPYKKNINGHPRFKEADGGSLEKSAFSELTYVWLTPEE